LKGVLPNFELEPLYDTLATLYQHILSSGLGKTKFPIQKKLRIAKELLYSREVLSRLTGKSGSSFCDILVGDGAYANRKDFRLCKEEYGCDLKVKWQRMNGVRGIIFSFPIFNELLEKFFKSHFCWGISVVQSPKK